MHEAASQLLITPVDGTPDSAVIAPSSLAPVGAELAPPVLTAELPTMPLEAAATRPELSDHNARLALLGPEAGKLALGNLVRAPYDRAALAVNGLRRIVLVRRVGNAERNAEELGSEAASAQEAAQSALDHRGMTAKLRPTTNRAHGIHLDAWQLKRRSIRRRGEQNNLASVYGRKTPTTGGDSYYGVNVTPELRKYYGYPVDTEDPYRTVLPPQPAEVAEGATVYRSTGGENDINTPGFAARIAETNMTPMQRRAALAAQHEFKHLGHKRHKKLSILERIADGTHPLVSNIEVVRDLSQTKASRGRRKLAKLQTASQNRRRAMAARATGTTRGTRRSTPPPPRRRPTELF